MSDPFEALRELTGPTIEEQMSTALHDFIDTELANNEPPAAPDYESILADAYTRPDGWVAIRVDEIELAAPDIQTLYQMLQERLR